MDLRYTPVVASRIVDVHREIKLVSSEALHKTFVHNGTCFYGQCHYCNMNDVVCGDKNGQLEGAIIWLIPKKHKLQTIRHPWQRTYKENVLSHWQTDYNFCLIVMKNNVINPRLLDLIDVSIFDYLIGNADRHHYEVWRNVPNSAVLLIDNGKSFGDPNHDELSILFPLLQCCMVRNSTFQRLKLMSHVKVSKLIRLTLDKDILWPLLTEDHLSALDRRVKKVLAAVQMCIDQTNVNQVLK